MNRQWSTALALGALLLLAPAAWGTTVIARDTEQLTHEADAIVVAECVGTRVLKEDGQLTTLVTFNVLDTLKGVPTPSVEVAVPGGFDTTGKFAVHQLYPGAPAFFEGQQALLFLNAAANGFDTIVGFNQGNFTILGEKLQRNLTGSKLVSASGTITHGGSSDIPLNAFLDAIRGYLAEQP